MLPNFIIIDFVSFLHDQTQNINFPENLNISENNSFIILYLVYNNLIFAFQQRIHNFFNQRMQNVVPLISEKQICL